MKVVAFQSDSQMLVSMSTKELAHICGIKDTRNLEGYFGIDTYCGYEIRGASEKTKVLAVEEIPVSDIYEDAVATIGAYAELQTKMVSVRNQLTFLTGKMAALSPTPEPEKTK